MISSFTSQPFPKHLISIKIYIMQRFRASQRLTLAQILTLFYVQVVLANEYNKKHNPIFQLGEYPLSCLKKELRLMSSNNEYMRDHISTGITLMNTMLNADKCFWIENFISIFICNKYNTLYLTDETWREIRTCLFEAKAVMKPPFRKGQLTFF